MMKNKIKLKKFLLTITLFSLFSMVLLLAINIYEQHIFTKNYNRKIVQIISQVKDEYPDLDENKLMSIINSDKVDESLLKKYSIDIDKDSLILENNKEYHKSLFINIVFLMITIIILILAFLRFNSKKEQIKNEDKSCKNGKN